MSKDKPFRYLNNILYGLSIGTGHLIEFYKNKTYKSWSMAMIKGNHKTLLLAHLVDKNLLPHIDLAPYFTLCDNFEELCYDLENHTSEQKTLDNFDAILDGWTKLYNEIRSIMMKELEPYREDILSHKEDLFEYCRTFLAYKEDRYQPDFVEHFIKEITR